MHPRKLFPILAVIVALALAALACGGGRSTEAPTDSPTAAARSTNTPEPTEEQVEDPTAEATSDRGGIAAGELSIRSHSSYIDTYNYVHVVGEIFNDTERPATDIELTVEIRDAANKSILLDSDGNPTESLTFSPLLYTIGPGETTPFDFYFSAEGAEPDSYTVTITGQNTGRVERASLEVQNGQIIFDDSGNGYISGEIVNTSDEPALINSLAGAAVSSDATVLAADYSSSVTRYLAPTGDSNGNDRTPFVVTLDGPIDESADWLVYFDADVADPVSGLSIAFDQLTGYFDYYGSFHMVGQVTNNSEETLSISLVAGLYADDGTVLDASTLSVPIYLASGESAPFNFEYFSSVNNNPSEADRLDNFTVQVDPYWTYDTSFETVVLETTNDTSEDQGDGVWHFAGDVTNTTTEDLSSATVVVAVYDADDNLIATQWTGVYPEGDAITPDQTNAWEVWVYLNPEVDSSDFTFATYVQGYVK